MTVSLPIKYPYLTNKNWGFVQVTDIGDTSNPGFVYLRRYILLKTPIGAIYIHRIYSPDSDPAPHNHPMPFISGILSGGYIEERNITQIRTRKLFTFAKTSTKDFHRILNLKKIPTTTIMLCGKRKQNWGFLTPQGYVTHEDYVSPIDGTRLGL